MCWTPWVSEWAFAWTVQVEVRSTGCTNKNNPIEKVLYIRNCNKLFLQNLLDFAAENSGLIMHRISLQCSVWFKDYNNLIFEVGLCFLCEQVIKLWYLCKNSIANISLWSPNIPDLNSVEYLVRGTVLERYQRLRIPTRAQCHLATITFYYYATVTYDVNNVHHV